MATFVNTQGACFLCSKILALENEESEEQGKLFNFQFICHRLKINAAAFTSDISKKYSTGFSAIVCSDCYKVVDRLSKLCEELEVIRMKVEDALIPFHAKLSKEGDISSRMGQVVNEEVGIAELIRMETQRKCNENFKMARLPRLILPRLESDGSSRPTTTAPTVRTQDLVPSIALVEFPVKMEVDQEEEWDIPLLDQLDVGIPWTLNLSDYLPGAEIETPQPGPGTQSGNSKEFTCNHCTRTFIQKVELEKHLIAVHPEKIFPDNKMKGVTDDEFRCCCKVAIDQMASEVIELRKTPRNRRNATYRCPFCKVGDRLLCKDIKIHQRHMVMKHYEVLCQKLVELQKRKKSLNLKAVTMAINYEFAKSERKRNSSSMTAREILAQID